MSLESEMKKFNANLERVSAALEALVPNTQPIPEQPEQPDTGFNPVTETKVVEPATKKAAKKAAEVAPELEAVVVADEDEEDEFDEFAEEAETADERPPLTAELIQDFAKEKIAKHRTTDPKVKTKIKAKITELGAKMITDLDQAGLVALEKFLSVL